MSKERLFKSSMYGLVFGIMAGQNYYLAYDNYAVYILMHPRARYAL